MPTQSSFTSDRVTFQPGLMEMSNICSTSSSCLPHVDVASVAVDKLFQIFQRLIAQVLARMFLTLPVFICLAGQKLVKIALPAVSILYVQIGFDRSALVTGQSKILIPLRWGQLLEVEDGFVKERSDRIIGETIADDTGVTAPQNLEGVQRGNILKSLE
ncbi:hypothetical protein MVEG_10440 [Podila verticillata NRRL 6337]|nr:hypothetical protein MVEG_10440 [Podila verticillata NRRL 6337]